MRQTFSQVHKTLLYEENHMERKRRKKAIKKENRRLKKIPHLHFFLPSFLALHCTLQYGPADDEIVKAAARHTVSTNNAHAWKLPPRPESRPKKGAINRIGEGKADNKWEFTNTQERIGCS